MTVVGEILMLIGGIFLFLGSLGLVRMPDVYNRLQTGTKASTLGAMSIGLSAIFLLPGAAGKAVLLVVFIVLANPVASNTIGRSAYLSGIKLSEKSVSDAWGVQASGEAGMVEGAAADATITGAAPEATDNKGA
jgi:multicomponent Na+:H+ antiporter subunit G